MTSTLSDTPPTDGAMARRSVVGETARMAAGWSVNEIHEWSMAERRGVLGEVDRLIAVLGMAKARILSVEEASGDWALSGAKDVAAWRAQSTRAGFGAAKGDLELATAVGELPRLGDAVTDGSMTLEHAKALAREYGTASDAQKQVLLQDCAVQDRLFKAARRTDAGAFRKSVKLTMVEIDPAKFQRDHDAVQERRFATLSFQGGGVRFEALLNTFDGRKLGEALNASMGRPGADDGRTRDQQRADGLVAMADAILAYGDSGRTGPKVTPDSEPLPAPLPGASRPNVMVIVSAADMAAWEDHGAFPRAVLDDDTPVPVAQFAATVCDGSILRLVLDAQGRPMETGQNTRTFTGTARNVLIARDRGCAWPGCGLAARYTEGHHVTWWSQGGKTTADNGILLCSPHHHMIHERKMVIVPVEGGFRFDKPDGTHEFRPPPGGPPKPPPGPPGSSPEGSDQSPDRGTFASGTGAEPPPLFSG